MGSTWARIGQGHDQAADEELIVAATRYLGYPLTDSFRRARHPSTPIPGEGNNGRTSGIKSQLKTTKNYHSLSWSILDRGG
jgi:hypothetical protein